MRHGRIRPESEAAGDGGRAPRTLQRHAPRRPTGACPGIRREDDGFLKTDRRNGG